MRLFASLSPIVRGGHLRNDGTRGGTATPKGGSPAASASESVGPSASQRMTRSSLRRAYGVMGRSHCPLAYPPRRPVDTGAPTTCVVLRGLCGAGDRLRSPLPCVASTRGRWVARRGLRGSSRGRHSVRATLADGRHARRDLHPPCEGSLRSECLGALLPLPGLRTLRLVIRRGRRVVTGRPVLGPTVTHGIPSPSVGHDPNDTPPRLLSNVARSFASVA